jgi:anion-transporting  ArsA/GET3 family ATPase
VYSHADARILRRLEASGGGRRTDVPANVRGVAGLLDLRLIFVTGKGGVGKSTVATALGLVAARSGLRTIVAELSAQEHVQRAFEHQAARFKEVELAPGLFTISIDPQHAMEEYLRIKVGPLGHALSASRLFHAFAMATPGMRELLSIGKVWELAQLQRQTRGAAPYDFVVVDAPATGHGVGILKTPRTFADIARVGPIARQGRKIADTIADPDFTGVIAVSTPEEMPVNETLALDEAVRADGLRLDAVIVNALYPERFDPDEAAELERALGRVRAPSSRAALRAALSENARAATQREQVTRLRESLGIDLVGLPYLFADRVGRPELELLADLLEPAVTGAAPEAASGNGRRPGNGRRRDTASRASISR